MSDFFIGAERPCSAVVAEGSALWAEAERARSEWWAKDRLAWERKWGQLLPDEMWCVGWLEGRRAENMEQDTKHREIETGVEPTDKTQIAPARRYVADSPLGAEIMRLVREWHVDASATRKLAGIWKADGNYLTAKLGEWWAESRELSAAQLERVVLQANETYEKTRTV